MTMSDRIGAVHVLQRFVMMSRTLVPSLMELMSKKKLSPDEVEKVERIKAVYETFNANPKMSEILINSAIFQLIKDVYEVCTRDAGQTPESFYVYNAFLTESDRLIETWNKQVLN